jgi:small subunit ribosomal protein S9
MAKVKVLQYYEGIGRRKSAVARVRLYIVNREKIATVATHKIKAGEMLVNFKPSDGVFSSDIHKAMLLQPFTLSELGGRFAVSVTVKGGGTHSQVEATIHGLARALELTDKEVVRPKLKKSKLLTRDSRIRERRKVGTGGKARRQKQSPKR